MHHLCIALQNLALVIEASIGLKIKEKYNIIRGHLGDSLSCLTLNKCWRLSKLKIAKCRKRRKLSQRLGSDIRKAIAAISNKFRDKANICRTKTPQRFCRFLSKSLVCCARLKTRARNKEIKAASKIQPILNLNLQRIEKASQGLWASLLQFRSAIHAGSPERTLADSGKIKPLAEKTGIILLERTRLEIPCHKRKKFNIKLFNICRSLFRKMLSI